MLKLACNFTLVKKKIEIYYVSNALLEFINSLTLLLLGMALHLSPEFDYSAEEYGDVMLLLLHCSQCNKVLKDYNIYLEDHNDDIWCIGCIDKFTKQLTAKIMENMHNCQCNHVRTAATSGDGAAQDLMDCWRDSGIMD